MKKQIFLAAACIAASTLAITAIVKKHPLEHWSFIDKTGHRVFIERITSGDLHENKRVFMDAFAALAKEYPLVMAQAPKQFKTINEFLDFAFEEYENKEFLAKKPNNYFVRALRDGQPVGYLSFEVKGDLAYIRNLAIAPACKGMGIGKELTRGVFKIRPDLKKATLIVSRANTPAIGFYQKLGFVETNNVPAGIDTTSWAGMELTA